MNNEFADSATDPKRPEWQGSSPAGRALVQQAQDWAAWQGRAGSA